MERQGTASIRAAWAALALAASLTCCGVAAARTRWDYPLLPHVKALAFFPSPLNDQQPTHAVLSSTFTQECWSAGELTVTDSAHVALELDACDMVADSVTGFTRDADLGTLAAGSHELTVRATVHPAVGDPVVEEITIPFEVVQGEPAPPPPPSDSGSTLISAIEVSPGSPTIADDVSVTWKGLAPYSCMRVTSARVVDASHLAMTLHMSPGCADSTRLWQQPFDLGVLAAGQHVYDLDIALELPDSTTHAHSYAGFQVTDPSAPPPPPVDSLRTVLSPTHPNPFSEVTRFSVSLKDPLRAQVGVYDLAGRRIATVFSGELPAGTSEMAWNGRRADGSRAAGGIYFYRLTLPGRVVTRRVVLLRTP